MEDQIKSLLGETRARLLAELRRGPRSIADLASELGVTDNAVRNHVAALARDGLVRPGGTRRDTGGKPSRLYELTDRGEELFPKAYAAVLGTFIQELRAQHGSARLHELLRAVGVRAAGPHTSSSDVAEAAVQAAAGALRELGGDVEIRRIAQGWQLIGKGCPLSSVVAQEDDTCKLVEAFVAQVSGLAAREQCDRSGRPRCRLQVSDTRDAPPRP